MPAKVTRASVFHAGSGGGVPHSLALAHYIFSKYNPFEYMSPLSSAAFQILVALSAGCKHGYAIMTEVQLNPGTLYTTIKRLLEDELIRETKAPPGAESSDERRRYYTITAQGRRAAHAELERLRSVVQSATSRLCDKPAR
jgi:DNA-binding PadR family transcriptional regulator